MGKLIMLMDQNMKGNLIKIIKEMEQEKLYIKMEMNIMEIGKMI